MGSPRSLPAGVAQAQHAEREVLFASPPVGESPGAPLPDAYRNTRASPRVRPRHPDVRALRGWCRRGDLARAGGRSRATLRTLRSGRYPYPQSVERDIIAHMGGRIYGPVHGEVLHERTRDGHRADGRCQRGARLGTLRGGRCVPCALCERPRQPHARFAASKPPREEGEGRRRVATRAKPVLVRCAHRRRAPEVCAHD